LKTKKLRSDR